MGPRFMFDLLSEERAMEKKRELFIFGRQTWVWSHEKSKKSTAPPSCCLIWQRCLIVLRIWTFFSGLHGANPFTKIVVFAQFCSTTRTQKDKKRRKGGDEEEGMEMRRTRAGKRGMVMLGGQKHKKTCHSCKMCLPRRGARARHSVFFSTLSLLVAPRSFTSTCHP
ncbi:hypothetical protein BC940DRAFT_307392 [Gongronella butleri]|nr:hypothetical protein BC940DRAFT_307392 [Gongronella butleri]